MEDKTFELLSKMYSDFSEFKKDLTVNVKDLTVKVDDLSNVVIKIENVHGQKLEALFDGWKQNTEQLERIEDDTKGIRKDLSTVELITANNWSDIAKLKSVK